MIDATNLTTALATAVAPSATDFVKKIGKEKYNEFIATYTNVFKDHVRATLERCSSIKTILHRDQSISLESQYVKLHFGLGQETVSDGEVVDYVSQLSTGSLISGLAGSGKSMFMKWAALCLIDKIPNTQRIPLFLEIRELPSAKFEFPFDQIIFEMSSSERSKATFDQFFIGLTEGQFIIMVDGLDEVPVKYRTSIMNEIADFKRRFPKASLICSSRPDRQLESSNALKVFRVQDMTVDQITSVIRNALFDEKKKEAFIEALENGLYDQHESFLSNPLLATIMLITYDVGTGVPSKLSLFYSQVFEALFYKHDSSKGVYVREHYSRLEIDEFESAFRTFCFQTYAMSKVAFLAPDLVELARTSLTQARISVSPGDFINDCKKSLCLLQEDGIYTSFVHRSFQEYFSARYLSSYGGEEYKLLVDEVVTRSFSDNTFRMLWQIDPEDVLRRWCLPKVEELKEELETLNTDDEEAVLVYLRKYASSAYFNPATGNGLVFSWAYRDGIRHFYAINEVLSACSVDARAKMDGGNIYKDSDPSSAPEAFLALMEPEEEEDQLEDDDIRYTGRETVRLSDLKPGHVHQTGLPAFLIELKNSLKVVEIQAARRLASTDDFARQVSRLFDASRGGT